jgi:hypothetical protein
MVAPLVKKQGKLIPIVLPKAVPKNVDKMARKCQIHSRNASRP